MAHARRCVIETEPRLETLFARSFPEATVLGRHRTAELQAQYSSVDCQIPSGDLPLHFRSSVEAFSARGAYLVAGKGAVERWGRRLAGLGSGLKVGISWRGGTARSDRVNRSVELDLWRPVLDVPNVHFISLQYDDVERDLAHARAALGTELHHWPEGIADYDETAALVCALDLVITVTTSVARVAGALGRSVSILANVAPRWCYLAGGDTTPWYASARVFRQSRRGAWDEVMRRVADAFLRGEA